ncbi:hypothetical protein AAKU55_003175 [Oxalobacteraceae bacterium GrIS 1.11]
MSAATKPVKAPSKRPTRTAALVPVTLTADESAWLLAYRMMDLRARGELLPHAVWQAGKYPMVRPPAKPSAPAGIRLVVAAGKRVSA